MKHVICHVEIPVADQAAAGAFYSELFGWEYRPMPEMDYAVFSPGEGPGGGFPKIDGQMFRANEPLVHVLTDDVDASLDKAVSLGGAVTVPKTEIPGIGWFGVFTDPSGNRIGLFKDGSS
jgi:uncharacterized protein